MTQPRLRVVPCELADANAFVDANHRHHERVVGHRWSAAVIDEDGAIRGVMTIGRPSARNNDQRQVLEVTRVATDGCENACSALYGAACRQQRAHGYKFCLTYTLESEPGTSLRAAGWREVSRTTGGTHDRPSRPRTDKAPTCPKIRWECPCSLLTQVTHQ